MEEENKTEGNTISLGGNIVLNGFKNIEKSKLVVLKKIVGNYVREIQEKRSDYEKLTLTLEGDEKNPIIKAELTAGGVSRVGEDSKSNIFMALDGALKSIIKQI